MGAPHTPWAARPGAVPAPPDAAGRKGSTHPSVLPVCARVVQSAYAGSKTFSTNSLIAFWSWGRPVAVPYWSATARLTSVGAAGYLGMEIALVFSLVSPVPKRRQNQERDDAGGCEETEKESGTSAGKGEGMRRGQTDPGTSAMRALDTYRHQRWKQRESSRGWGCLPLSMAVSTVDSMPLPDQRLSLRP